MTMLDEVRETALMFLRSAGRKPARIKVGRAALDAMADETNGIWYPRVSKELHRERVVKAAKRGELFVYGMRVQLEPKP